METMTIPTTWLSLPSYGTSGTTAPCADALVLMGQPGTGVVRDSDGFGFAPRIKDVRPGSRAWSPPV